MYKNLLWTVENSTDRLQLSSYQTREQSETKTEKLDMYIYILDLCLHVLILHKRLLCIYLLNLFLYIHLTAWVLSSLHIYLIDQLLYTCIINLFLFIFTTYICFFLYLPQRSVSVYLPYISVSAYLPQISVSFYFTSKICFCIFTT